MLHGNIARGIGEHVVEVLCFCLHVYMSASAACMLVRSQPVRIIGVTHTIINNF